MAQVSITAEPRSDFGKGAARRTRREGRVPAVIYGKGSEPRHVSLPDHDLTLALRHPGLVLEVTLDGKTPARRPARRPARPGQARPRARRPRPHHQGRGRGARRGRPGRRGRRRGRARRRAEAALHAPEMDLEIHHDDEADAGDAEEEA